MLRIFILLVVTSPILAQVYIPLRLHENSRVLGLGGAYVAVADDPQSALLNPAGFSGVKQIGHDLSLSTQTGDFPDQLATMLVNPGSERGAVFGAGFLAQGLLKGDPVKYYVPFSGTSWTLFGRSSLGLVMRFPYRTSPSDSIDARWEAIGDFGAMQGFGSMLFGAQVERMFGGAADMVPRRLRAGTSIGRPGEYLLAYEWRGEETNDKFDFHYDSSHLGGEIVTKKYVALRTGYVWGDTYYVTAGAAFGLIQSGLRFETGWQFPTGHGDTRWSIGVGYRG